MLILFSSNVKNKNLTVLENLLALYFGRFYKKKEKYKWSQFLIHKALVILHDIKE